MWNLLRNVRGYTKKSLSQPTAASSLFKGAYIQISLPFREGEPAKLVEGFLCGIFCVMCEVTRKYPSVTCGDSSPFRGAYSTRISPPLFRRLIFTHTNS